MKNLIKKEILSWMNEGLPSGKTIPIFEDILDKFEALVIEEVIKEIENNGGFTDDAGHNCHYDDELITMLNKLK